jgi:hypothetical protein
VIHQLVACSGAATTATPDQLQPRVARATEILEKYQEQPTLLDRHLAEAVSSSPSALLGSLCVCVYAWGFTAATAEV